jgi:pentatricopeptide repeat protein
MNATKNNNVFVLYKSNLMSTLVKRGLIRSTLSLFRLLKGEGFSLA